MPVQRRRLLAALSTAALVAILALGVALRFWALDFGLPHPLVRPDEREILMPSFGFARGDLNPHYHVYPGLYLYLVWLWGEAGLALRRLFVETPPYPTVLLKDIAGAPGGTGGQILLIGRALSAIAGSLSVWLVYLYGKRHDGRATGLVAAALLATCFLHVRDSHALKAEALFTLAVLPAIAACAQVAQQPTVRRGVAAGLWIGVATGMKQPGALLAIPLYAAAALGSPERGVRRWLPGAPVVLGVLAAMALFLATGPYLVLDWGFVWHQMGPSVGTVFAPTGEVHHQRAFLYHLTTSFRHGCGLAFSLLCVPALLLGARGREPFFVLATLFSLVWLVTIGVSPVHHVRYLTPILPLLALLVARLLAHLARLAGRAAVPALVVATALVAAEPLAASVAHDRILARTDTRDLAAEWLVAHTRPGEEVAVLGTKIWPYGAPVMPPGVTSRHLALRDHDLELGAASLLVTHEHQLPFSQVDPADLAALKPRLTLQAEFTPYSGPQPGGWFEEADAYYAPFYDFAGVARPGPLIRIYSVAPAPGGPADGASPAGGSSGGAPGGAAASPG